jgi:pilus assembly protein Flp/PilA
LCRKTTGTDIPKRKKRECGCFRRSAADESGATSIEYGLICAAIAIALIALINSLGENLITMLTRLLDAFP